MRGLGSYIVMRSLLISSGAMLAIGFVVVFVVERAIEGEAVVSSRQMADAVFARVHGRMESGALTGMRISDLVREEVPSGDGWNIEVAPGTGGAAQPSSSVEDGHLRLEYPLVAGQSCLGCHPGTAPGAAMATVVVHKDVASGATEAARAVGILVLFLVPFPILGGLLVARGLAGRLRRPIEWVRGVLHGLRVSDDPSAASLQGMDLGFREFNALGTEVVALVEHLRGIAEDLRVQNQLLRATTLGEEAPRDWRQEAARLFGRLCGDTRLRAMALAFEDQRTGVDLHCFWSGKPGGGTAAALEATVLGRLGRAPGEGAPAVSHVPVEGCGDLAPEATDIAASTALLCPGAPAIGGIVGVALVADRVPPQRALHAVLPTLLTVVGSLRAMDRYTRELEYHATRDGLTGLFNKKVFWEFLAYEVDRAQRHSVRFSVMVIDLDGFKYVNDSYGHAFGDELLKEVAAAIRKAVRREDIPARHGGDEFCVILPGADCGRAGIVARRVLGALSAVAAAAPGGDQVTTTASVGVACYPDAGTGPDELFAAADKAMYRAKAEGKNRVVLADRPEAAGARLDANDMLPLVNRAVREGLLVPYFQPLLNLRTGRIDAHEVLMRLVLPEMVVPACDFIETAEAIGIMPRIDLILIEKTLKISADAGYGGLLFVNLTPRALAQQGYLQEIVALTERYRLDPARLVIELTERDTVRNMAAIEGFIRDARSRGFEFAVDDFGSGYSSLQYLRRFPLGVVKLDGEFVRGLKQGDRVDLAIMSSMTTLAAGLGLRTVAEMVEDGETIRSVRRLGVHWAQGYCVGRPAPAFATEESCVDRREVLGEDAPAVAPAGDPRDQ